MPTPTSTLSAAPEVKPAQSAFEPEEPKSAPERSTLSNGTAPHDAKRAAETADPNDAESETSDATDAEPSPDAPEPRYTLAIDDGVVEKISALAAQQVEGIVEMKGSVLSMIQEGLGGNDRTKGVSASVGDDRTARVELSIILEYGASATEVFDELKRVIADDVHEMCGLSVAELTVNVVDVMDREEACEKFGACGSEDAPEAEAEAEAA